MTSYKKRELEVIRQKFETSKNEIEKISKTQTSSSLKSKLKNNVFLNGDNSSINLPKGRDERIVKKVTTFSVTKKVKPAADVDDRNEVTIEKSTITKEETTKITSKPKVMSKLRFGSQRDNQTSTEDFEKSNLNSMSNSIPNLKSMSNSIPNLTSTSNLISDKFNSQSEFNGYQSDQLNVEKENIIRMIHDSVTGKNSSTNSSSKASLSSKSSLQSTLSMSSMTDTSESTSITTLTESGDAKSESFEVSSEVNGDLETPVSNKFREANDLESPARVLQAEQSIKKSFNDKIAKFNKSVELMKESNSNRNLELNNSSDESKSRKQPISTPKKKVSDPSPSNRPFVKPTLQQSSSASLIKPSAIKSGSLKFESEKLIKKPEKLIEKAASTKPTLQKKPSEKKCSVRDQIQKFQQQNRIGESTSMPNSPALLRKNKSEDNSESKARLQVEKIPIKRSQTVMPIVNVINESGLTELVTGGQFDSESIETDSIKIKVPPAVPKKPKKRSSPSMSSMTSVVEEDSFADSGIVSKAGDDFNEYSDHLEMGLGEDIPISPEECIYEELSDSGMAEESISSRQYNDLSNSSLNPNIPNWFPQQTKKTSLDTVSVSTVSEDQWQDVSDSDTYPSGSGTFRQPEHVMVIEDANQTSLVTIRPNRDRARQPIRHSGRIGNSTNYNHGRLNKRNSPNFSIRGSVEIPSEYEDEDVQENIYEELTYDEVECKNVLGSNGADPVLLMAVHTNGNPQTVDKHRNVVNELKDHLPLMLAKKTDKLSQNLKNMLRSPSSRKKDLIIDCSGEGKALGAEQSSPTNDYTLSPTSKTQNSFKQQLEATLSDMCYDDAKVNKLASEGIPPPLPPRRHGLNFSGDDEIKKEVEKTASMPSTLQNVNLSNNLSDSNDLNSNLKAECGNAALTRTASSAGISDGKRASMAIKDELEKKLKDDVVFRRRSNESLSRPPSGRQMSQMSSIYIEPNQAPDQATHPGDLIRPRNPVLPMTNIQAVRLMHQFSVTGSERSYWHLMAAETPIDKTFADGPLYQFYQQDVCDRAEFLIDHQTSVGSNDNYEDEIDRIYQEHSKDKKTPSTSNNATKTLNNATRTPSSSCSNRMPDYFNTPGPQRTLWSQVPSVRASGILMQLSDKEKKAQEAMFEVISSEASYYKSLNILVHHFFQSRELSYDGAIINPLDRGCLSDRERAELFSNIIAVHDVAHRLLTDLQKRFQQNMVMVDICDILYDFATRHFFPYISYCQNQQLQDRAFERLRKTKVDFVQALVKLESHPICQSQSLHSFLMLPMQRITRYPILVEAVLQHLDESSPNYQTCKKALAALNQVVHKCNEEAKKVQRIQELLKIESQLKFGKIKKCAIISEARWLVRSGEATRLVTQIGKKHTAKASKGTIKGTSGGTLPNLRWKSKSTYLFLFNDLLILSKKKGENYSVLDYCTREMVELLPLINNSDLESGPSSPGFSLPLPPPAQHKHIAQLVLHENHQNKFVEHTLSFPSETERLRWMEAISPPTSADPDEKLYEVWDCPQVQCVTRYVAAQPDELSLEPTDVVNVSRQKKDGWCEGERIRDGARGWFPNSHTKEIVNRHVIARNKKLKYRLLMITENFLEEQKRKSISNH